MEEQQFPITFRRAEEIIEFDDRCRVPGHLEGRKTIHGEVWILGRYLRTLLEADRLTFPFTVERAAHSQSPDFMLKSPDGVLSGVEVTEASTPEAHHRFMEKPRRFGGIGRVRLSPSR